MASARNTLTLSVIVKSYTFLLYIRMYTRARINTGEPVITNSNPISDLIKRRKCLYGHFLFTLLDYEVAGAGLEPATSRL
jgi:hypothetical protein